MSGPDYLGFELPGNSNVAIAASPELAPNQWFAIPEAKGPIPPNGIGNATMNVAPRSSRVPSTPR